MQTVIVAGRILVEDGHVCGLDEAALVARCRATAQRLWQRAGITTHTPDRL